jgi:hypothetical protein
MGRHIQGPVRAHQCGYRENFVQAHEELWEMFFKIVFGGPILKATSLVNFCT